MDQLTEIFFSFVDLCICVVFCLFCFGLVGVIGWFFFALCGCQQPYGNLLSSLPHLDCEGKTLLPHLGWGKQKWHIPGVFSSPWLCLQFFRVNTSLHSDDPYSTMAHSFPQPNLSSTSKGLLVDASKPSHLCTEIAMPCLRYGELFVTFQHQPINLPKCKNPSLIGLQQPFISFVVDGILFSFI